MPPLLVLLLLLLAWTTTALPLGTLSAHSEDDNDHDTLEGRRRRAKCLTLASFTPPQTFSQTTSYYRIGYREIDATCDLSNLDDALRAPIPSPMVLQTSPQERKESFTDAAELKFGFEERVSLLGVDIRIAYTSSSTFTLHYSATGCDALDDLAGYGGGETDAFLQYGTKYRAQVRNRKFLVPSLYIRSAKVWILVVTTPEPDSYLRETMTFGSTFPVSYTRRAPRPSLLVKGQMECAVEFSTAGTALRAARAHKFDVYLARASSAGEAQRATWALTGPPRLPPFWALGFMASRWGWESRQYISDVLEEFDEDGTPIDAFLMDFEWYLNGTGDYRYPVEGVPNFPDFAFGNARTFPDPRAQAEEYFNSRNVRMGGIRKPRLGDAENLRHALEAGLLLRPGVKRDLNFGLEQTKEFYAARTRAFRASSYGIPSFFWNDEGETSYFTYHDWITAQQRSENEGAVTKRRFSINRSFTLGLQRLEATAIWTGDIESSWKALTNAVDQTVRWSEAGISLPCVDLGGFQGGNATGTLLARFYQFGAFLGVMRVHSTLYAKPHFPFTSLWGEPYAGAMRDAVRLRYALLPSLYASLHRSFREGRATWMSRPETTGGGSSQTCYPACFLVNDGNLLVFPVLREDSTIPVLSIPATETAKWWVPMDLVAASSRSLGAAFFDASRPSSILAGVVPLNRVVAFGKAGSILLLHVGNALPEQRASEIVGSRSILRVVICVGGDAEGFLFEDDGGVGSGQEGPMRRTTFTWNESGRKLSWATTTTTTGNDAVPRWYSRGEVVAVERDGTRTTAEINLDVSSGSGEVVILPPSPRTPPQSLFSAV